mmetsp:Transcript_15807/g.43875  ORF Transcript_15807/g.43875 Transcript_15807/m.43875 type:complete len:229 (-) Transcript_15807:274-960(-)
MLVEHDAQRLALLLRHGHRHDLAVEEAALLGGQRLGLRRQRHAVLRLALDAEVPRDVLRRLGHRVDAVLRLHEFVHEAPADGRVVDRVAAAERALGLGHHEGRAAHALHAAGDHQPGLAGADGARRRAHRVQARTAQPVDRHARHVDGQACEQGGHAGHVAVVLAGLVGAAVDHILHRRPVQARVAGHQGLERQRAEVIGADAGQRAAVAAEGGAEGVADEGLRSHRR